MILFYDLERHFIYSELFWVYLYAHLSIFDLWTQLICIIKITVLYIKKNQQQQQQQQQPQQNKAKQNDALLNPTG